MIVYRPLVPSQLTPALFSHFVRRQEVGPCWRRIRGRWRIWDDPFVDDWSQQDYSQLLFYLRRTLETGGFVYGAFCQGALKGFVSVEPQSFGPDLAYLDLSSLHVSQDMRGQGIGTALFQAARIWAMGHGGRKLYISAHSAAETQAFYRSLGCIDARYLHPAHVQAEPYDCQLEYPLYTPIAIRPYRSQDCPALARLFYETVHSVCTQDYTPQQLDAWATGQVDLTAWDQSLQAHRSLVALDGDTIAGFADMDDSGYLDRLYVHRDYQRRGIASTLCTLLEAAVPGAVTTHASYTARPFFEKRGYRLVRQQQVLRQGIALTNFVMELPQIG